MAGQPQVERSRAGAPKVEVGGPRNAVVGPPTLECPDREAGPVTLERASGAALEAHLAAWAELAEQALEPNPFYEPFALLPALRHLAGADRVEVLLAWGPHPSLRKGERQLLGLFPLAPRQAGGPVPQYELWRHPFCYLTLPLLRRGQAQPALAAFLDAFAGRGLLRLEDVPGEGPFRRLLVAELRRRDWASLVGDAYTRALFRPAESAEAYLARALPGKRRKELRRLRARLDEQGPVAVEAAEDPLAAERAVEELLWLEERGWKGRQHAATAAHPGGPAYLRELSERARQAGRLDLLTLRVGGRAVAVKHNLLAAGGGAVAFKIAYDEAFARFSPGVLLELENVERLHARPGVRWMDSCAAPERFMINHLWTDRREVQTLFLAPQGSAAALAMSLLPLARWFRSRMQSLKGGAR